VPYTCPSQLGDCALFMFPPVFWEAQFKHPSVALLDMVNGFIAVGSKSQIGGIRSLELERLKILIFPHHSSIPSKIFILVLYICSV
jgi:hypothetical protein